MSWTPLLTFGISSWEPYKWGNLIIAGKLSEEMAVEQYMVLFGQASWFLCFSDLQYPQFIVSCIRPSERNVVLFFLFSFLIPHYYEFIINNYQLKVSVIYLNRFIVSISFLNCKAKSCSIKCDSLWWFCCFVGQFSSLTQSVSDSLQLWTAACPGFSSILNFPGLSNLKIIKSVVWSILSSSVILLVPSNIPNAMSGCFLNKSSSLHQVILKKLLL